MDGCGWRRLRRDVPVGVGTVDGLGLDGGGVVGVGLTWWM